MARAKLYALLVSHPSHSVRLMLERKGIEHQVVNLQPGLHPLAVRLAGFRGSTVPALRIDGRRVQESLRISRFLDELQPEPALFPADRRDAVVEAEAWGEREFQPVPRRMYRWGLGRSAALRRGLAELSPLPGAGFQTVVNQPLARMFAAMVGANDATVERDVRALPGMLDHVDGLIESGVIGTDQPNAADFQIVTTVRVLMSMADLRPLVAGRPAEGLAQRLLPEWPDQVPAFLPQKWLANATGAKGRDAATRAARPA
jgi:glutathione S-transferase